MGEVFVWAAIYITAMLVGYVCKRIGLFHPEDRKLLSDIILYITLPAMLVSSFGGVTVDFWFVVAFLTGFLLNLLMVVLAWIASAKKSPDLQATYIINGAGLNLGNIGIPFLRNFFPTGIPYLCMFDVGDCMFTLGTTYAIAGMRLGKQTGSKWQSIVKSLFSSPPFLAYFTMALLSLLHITLPSYLIQLAEFMGQGNGFLAMLMVGISLELNLNREMCGEVFKILGLRYLCGAAAALVVYFLIPAPDIMRQILPVAVFAAAPNVALVYTSRLGIRTDVASALNTISTILMIPVMSLIMLLVR